MKIVPSSSMSMSQPNSSVMPRIVSPPLPMTPAEVSARGWDAVDVVFVTGDAYVDHPSFAMAILGRVLEAGGFRVGMISQPDWRSCEPWRVFEFATWFVRGRAPVKRRLRDYAPPVESLPYDARVVDWLRAEKAAGFLTNSTLAPAARLETFPVPSIAAPVVLEGFAER